VKEVPVARRVMQGPEVRNLLRRSKGASRLGSGGPAKAEWRLRARLASDEIAT